MPRIHTHYDNLKVMRNAPPEVIRAVYKTLSQKFHPDRNPLDKNATHTFQIIGRAYDVLSDPVKRREHDLWIASVEAVDNEPRVAVKPLPVARPMPAHAPRQRREHRLIERYARRAWGNRLGLSVAGLVLICSLFIFG